MPGDLVDLDGISAGYGEFDVLHGCTLRAKEAQTTVILGANGAGKTTLLRTMMGLLRVSSGSGEVCGLDVKALKTHQLLKHGVAYVPEGRELFSFLTVEDNLRVPLSSLKDVDGDAAIAEVYRTFPVLGQRRRQLAATLSGGEQQMVALGRAMVAQPRLCLLDEPSLGLAPKYQELVFETIGSFNDRGMSVILVEQNAARALEIADYGFVMSLGRIVTEGPGDQLNHDPELINAYLGGSSPDGMQSKRT